MIQSEWLNGQMDISIPLAIRKTVFGTDRDAFDEYAMICVFYVDDTPVGTGRIYHDGSVFRVDNICVLEEYRGQHIGDLMSRLLLYKTQQFAEEVHITSPCSLTGFFVRYGFGPNGDVFTQDGVEYLNMKVKKDDIAFPSECKGCQFK